MYYASFGALAIILHLIINHDYLKRQRGRDISPAAARYKMFLIGVMFYYVSDILWGYLYGLRIIPLAYADTVLYFFSMVVSVLFWTRFVVSYLDARKIFSRFLTYAGWTIFWFEVIHLVVNFFNPIIFTFDESKTYIPGHARYITLAAQVLLFVMASVYTIVMAVKLEGKERNRHRTVGISGIVMSIFIVLQTQYPFLPFYAIGLLIGTCMIHILVEEDIKMEHAIELGKARDLAERERHELEIAKEVAEQERRELVKANKKTITFNRIAESLAANYDVIYYVSTDDSSFVGYATNEAAGRLDIQVEGDDFFEVSRKKVEPIIHPDDRERLFGVLDRDYLLTTMEDCKQFTLDYRLIVEGKQEYTRLSVRKSGSGEHFIIGAENIDAEVRREKAQMKALSTEKELARRDELTGTKNKTAFAELEQTVDGIIESGEGHQPFAIVVCDINDLKNTNDTEGHKAGDDLIRAAAKLLCDTFAHSPVFRIGGDEFAIFLRGEDYESREMLIGRLRVQVLQNLVSKDGPVVAVGFATFDPGRDEGVTAVFERADTRMYEDKKGLKG